MDQTLWQDLWRRRVPHIVGVYLGISWGVVEFVGFMVDQYVLSYHLVTLSLVVLASFLPSVGIVAYFHGTPGRQGWTKVERIGIPCNLMALGVLLSVVFSGKDLGAATTTVTVTDEEGVETERVIPKTEFRKRISLYFFDAEPADTAAAWLQYGLPIAVVTDLVQDQFLDMRFPLVFADRLREAGFPELVNVPLSLAREIADEQHRDHFVTGRVALVDGEIQATVSLYEAQRGRLVEERAFSGTDVMDLADRISEQLRSDLKVPDLGEEGAQDLPVAEILTRSPAAFRLFIESVRSTQVDQDFVRGTALMEEAAAEDPTYADAQATLARLYMFTNRGAEIAGPLQAAMDHIYRLPERSRFIVKSDYYFLVRQDTDRAMAALDMWADLFPDDIQAHQNRVQIQFLRDDKDGALTSLETILELDPEQRDVLLQIGSLHESRGDFTAAREALQQYAEEFPESHQVLTQLAALARRMGSLEEARGYYDRALLLDPSDVGLMVGMGAIERATGHFDEAMAQYEAAMATAGTPEERAQVLSAMEGYYMARGQVGRSIELMEERLSEAQAYLPGFVVVQQRLIEAGTYAEAGRLDEAWALVEEARTQLPPPFDGMAPLGEMDIYLTLEDADGIEATVPAVEGFITGLKYEILRPALLAAQAEARVLTGEYREAIRLLEEEQRLAPSSTSIPMELGRCYRGLEEYDRAVSLLQEALRVSPYGARENYEMALTYEAMGRMDDARIHIDRALDVWADADPTYKWARRAREALARLQGGQN